MKKPQLISLSSYCSQATAFDIQDLIKEAVQKEDEVNHPYKRIDIPKIKYPKMRVDWITGHSFFSKILP